MMLQGVRVWTATARGTTINSIMSSSRMKCDSLGNVYVCGTFSVDDSVYRLLIGIRWEWVCCKV
ncbi:MAG: hypothetical protein IPG39_17705 [Bacteroidetes bacterium]|nr:hypothetical protein [Bacteroidota bacterium]